MLSPEIDALYIRHPDDEVHAKQVRFLEVLPEPDKSYHAQLFRFGNAAMHYYHKSEPTEDDYKDWLSGLPENLRMTMTVKGYHECKTILALQRHALERRDVGMDEYIRKLLNDQDFKLWQSIGI
jgi:hypothetical protein